MNKEIREVTKKRFNLAHSTAITRSILRHLVGYCATTTFAMDLLNEREVMLADMDNDTAMLIYEFQWLFKHLKHKHVPVDISPDNYCFYWGRVSESTSSAKLAVHFGHWKALAKNWMLVDFICTQLNLIAQTGSTPSRWGVGLQVLLEKVPGMSLVDKLRAILLMEGDFNFFNKWVFGRKAINQLYKMQYVPDDQYSQREGTTEDSKFDNRLTMDLSRQFHQPLVAISAEADKCFDCINHIVMSLLLQAIVGETGAVNAMLRPIQSMKFFQRTGRGDSNTHMGGRPESNPLQGLSKGMVAHQHAGLCLYPQ
jgi:hypothetical protein